MDMIYGYTGKILFVDLSTGELRDETPDEQLYRDYLGGYGLGARILYDRQRPNVDPLGPENHIGFLTGPITGIRGLPGSRFTVVGKSPLTGCWGDSNCGGYFGPYLRYSGYDAVFVRGVSPDPVYLFIDDGKPELRDANHLWGMDSRQIDDAFKSEFGKKVAVACIGPAGERLSLISCIMHDIGTAAGRAGFGAVMGSKKLKAIAVRGTQNINVPDQEKVSEMRREFIGMLAGDIYEGFKKYGTCYITAESIENGDAPVKNWAGTGITDFPNGKAISDDAVIALQERRHACLRCPVACKGIMKEGREEYRYEAGGHKPEYETLVSFGSLLLNDNLESITKANDICNRYGLDTISAGASIAFAIECYESGVISSKDTDGIVLNWGNHAAIVEMLEKLAKREGFGDILADGVKRASERIGKGAGRFAIHAGGQELPMHDPRFMPTMATAYSCDPAPGRHTSGCIDAAFSANFRIMDTIGMCLIQWTATFFALDMPKLLSAVTGWEVDHDELMRTGHRISNIRQAFTVREGIVPNDYKISSGRPVGEPPLADGPLAGVTLPVDDLRNELFKAMDWDIETGKPSKEKLLELGLQDIIRDFWP